jgi:hypothetical protein
VDGGAPGRGGGVPAPELAAVTSAVVDRLLPAPVRIADVDTQKVYLSAPGAERIDLLELSDGYRSFLALVMGLLRQTADVFGAVTNHVQRRDGRRAVGSCGRRGAHRRGRPAPSPDLAA